MTCGAPFWWPWGLLGITGESHLAVTSGSPASSVRSPSLSRAVEDEDEDGDEDDEDRGEAGRLRMIR